MFSHCQHLSILGFILVMTQKVIPGDMENVTVSSLDSNESEVDEIVTVTDIPIEMVSNENKNIIMCLGPKNFT